MDVERLHRSCLLMYGVFSSRILVRRTKPLWVSVLIDNDFFCVGQNTQR